MKLSNLSFLPFWGGMMTSAELGTGALCGGRLGRIRFLRRLTHSFHLKRRHARDVPLSPQARSLRRPPLLARGVPGTRSRQKLADQQRSP